MNELDLMDLHCRTCYVLNARSELVRINDWLERPAPMLWIGFTRLGVIRRFRADLPGGLRATIDTLIGSEPAGCGDGRLPRHHDRYCALLSPDSLSAGPVHWLPDSDLAGVERGTPITATEAHRLRATELEAWIPDIPHQQPMMASCADGKAAAVCASVRILPEAHQAGVETVSGLRRRGHASIAVRSWARAVVEAGALPLYSTAWDNHASRGLAGALGFEPFGWEYRLD